jgi:hypothetical protein
MSWVRTSDSLLLRGFLLSYTRPINQKATKIARAKQRRGIAKLAAAFGLHEREDPPFKVREVIIRGMQFGDSTGRGTPVRLHPNTPPVRDAEHQAKHKKRKIVNASRRKNRK